MVPIIAVGNNPTPIWGMDVGERIRRIARAFGSPDDDAGSTDGATLLVNTRFVCDPLWLKHYRKHRGSVLTMGGVPAIAHVRNAAERAQVEAAMVANSPIDGDTTLTIIAHENAGAIVNAELRKRETPFILPLEPATVRAVERASYFGAYKGVTDVLTKYLWPEMALVLTRIAARAGITPNMVTTVGAILCIVATWLFWYGHYWTGMAAGLGFMVLDTVDGKLARCTITSSKWGNVFDHGLDLVHPPFWWYAWGVGLSAWGLALSPAHFDLVMVAIVGGYVVQRLIEGAFMRLYGMHIHVWRKLDSDFRLITARRNPNMVILFVSVIAQRPDIGLVAVAWWTILSCLFHLVRLIQAMAAHGRKEEISSWLA